MLVEELFPSRMVVSCCDFAFSWYTSGGQDLHPWEALKAWGGVASPRAPHVPLHQASRGTTGQPGIGYCSSSGFLGHESDTSSDPTSVSEVSSVDRNSQVRLYFSPLMAHAKFSNFPYRLPNGVVICVGLAPTEGAPC